MSYWRKEHDHRKGVVVYHCDEHDYHASDPFDIEEHSKVHGKILAHFWTRIRDPETNLGVFSCHDHRFKSSNPLEIEEHERLHAMETGIRR